MNVADAASYSSVLLLNLSDNLLEQSRDNPVVVQQEEMDRVGFEPTISAHSILRQSAIDVKLVQIPPSPFSVHAL
jgi:hypothetical protein